MRFSNRRVLFLGHPIHSTIEEDTGSFFLPILPDFTTVL